MMTFLKKLISSFCILAILHSSLWSATAPIEYDALTRTARIRAVLDGAKHAELIGHITSGSIHNLMNYGDFTLPSHVFGQLKTFQNYGEGVAAIEVMEDSLTLPAITHNEGLLRIRSSENLHIHAHTLFNHGEINCIDGRPEEGEDPLRWHLHLETIKNKGAILADVSLIVGDLERTIDELEGVLVGQNIRLANVTQLKAFIYAGYGVPETPKEEGNGNFSYIYEGREDTPAAAPIQGAIFARGFADFTYPNAQDVSIAAFLNVGGMGVRMMSEESGQLFLERDPLNAPTVESDALYALKTLLHNSSLEHICDLWPNLLFATDAPSHIGPKGVTIQFGGAEKGNVFISSDYTVEGTIETHNVDEFQVLDTATVLYQNDVILNTQELVVGGTFALGDPTKSPQFRTSARLYVSKTGAFNAHRLVYGGTADTVHTNLGNVSIKILDQTKPLYLENFGYANVSRVRGTNTALHLRNNHGYITTTAPLSLRYTKEGLEELDEEAPVIDGYAETSHPAGIKVVLEKQTKFPAIFWNQSVKSLGPLVFEGKNTIHFKESSSLESAHRVRLGGPGGRILDGTIKTPNLVLEGKCLEGSGLLDAPSIIVKTDMFDTSHFRFGETLRALQITCDKKLVLGGGNSAEGFVLEDKLLLSGKGTLSLKSSIQARNGVFAALTGNSLQELEISSPRIVSSHGPVEFTTPIIKFQSTPHHIEGGRVLIQADNALRLRENITLRSPGEAGSINVQTGDALKVEGNLRAENINLGTGKNLTLNTRKSSWKTLTLDVPNGRTDFITGVRADGLTVHTQTFVPTAAIRVAEAMIESEFLSLDHISMEADWAHIYATDLRSHGATLGGTVAFEGSTHEFRDLGAGKADVDFAADQTSLRGDTRLKKAHVTSKTVLMEGDVRAESITGLEDVQHFSLFGKLLTQQKEFRARAQKMHMNGKIGRLDGTPFDMVELSGGEAEIQAAIETLKLLMDFDGRLNLSESHLKANQSVLRAQEKLTAYHLFLDAIDSVISADSIGITSSHLEGGDHVITTAKEAREATDAATAASLSHEAHVLTGDVDLLGTTVKSLSLGLHTGTAAFDPTSIHTEKTHVGLQTFDPVGGKSGVQAAVALGHALTGSDRVTVDARRVPETLRIDGHDRWRPNLTMEVADFAMGAGASLRSDGDLGVVSETNIQALRAQIEARNLLLEARQGTVDLVATQVRATENLKLKAALDIILASLSERTGGGDNYTDHKVAAGAGAGGALSMEAFRHIMMTSVDTHSGTGTTLKAGGKILDLALDLVTQRTHHHRRGYTRDKWTHRATSSHTSGGTFVSQAGDTQELFAPRIQAKKASIWGEEGVNIYDVHDEHEHESHYKKKGGLFSSSKEVHTKSHTATSRGAHITADEIVHIGSRKDVNLTNIHVVVPKTILESVEGSVRLLLGTNYHSSFTTVKRSNAFWQGRGYSLEEHETYSASSFAGDVEVKAKQELLVQQVKEKTLEFLDRVRVLDGQLTFEFLEEFHKSESDYKDGPTAALAAVVVIAVTIATAGSGGPAADAGLKAATLAGQVTAAGTLTAAGTVISSMTAAAFTSLCTQSAIALLSAKGDIGQALKTICTPNTLKSIAFSAVTAGVTSGVGTYLGAASDPIGKIGVAIAKNTAGAAVRSILTGEDLGTGILRGVATAGIDVLAEEAAGAIGLKRSVDGLEAASTIPDFVAYTLHGAVGAGVGALTAIATGEKDIEGYALSGGLGAVVAEVAADLMTKDLRNIDTIVHENPGMTGAQLKEKLRAITEDKRKIAQFLGAAAGGFTGGHAYMADHMAENATTHNFIPMVMIGIELASLCVDMAVEYRKAEKVKEGSGREALTEYLGGAGFGAVAMKLVSRFASPAALKLLGGVLNASEIIDSGAGLVDAVQKAYRGESVDWLATTQAFLNAVLATRTFKGKAAHVKASHETVHVPEMSFGKGIHKQGMPFENYVATKMPKGARLPKNFKTFDFYDQNTGIATSVKTLDTKTPARLARPEGIFSTLKRGIDKTVEFDGARLSNMNLKSDMISDRHVLVGVPETTGADQWTQLQRAVEYGAARGVQVKIFKVVQ